MTLSFADRCHAMRQAIVDMAACAKRGHIPSALSTVEILVTLYDHVLRIDPRHPKDPNRDRFILSKGHGCMALYALLADKGFFPASWCKAFCRFDGMLGGHPEERVPGVEASTGSLGHGLSIGIGMALSGRMRQAPYRVFVLLGDGECTEGSVWEGALAASKHRLDNLTVLVDYNQYTSFGPTQMVGNLEPFAEKWRKFGFSCHELDLLANPQALKQALESPTREAGLPVCYLCKTIKGQGIDFMEGDLSWHHKSKIEPEEIEAMRSALARGARHA
jgi:transketolase